MHNYQSGLDVVMLKILRVCICLCVYVEENVICRLSVCVCIGEEELRVFLHGDRSRDRG